MWCCSDLKNYKLFPPSRLFHSNLNNQNNAWAKTQRQPRACHCNGRAKIKIQVSSVRYKLFVWVTYYCHQSWHRITVETRQRWVLQLPSLMMSTLAKTGRCYRNAFSILLLSTSKWSHKKDFDLPKSCFNQVNSRVKLSWKIYAMPTFLWGHKDDKWIKRNGWMDGWECGNWYKL